MSRVIRCYPRAWRARYEAELRELLEERPVTFRGRLDLVRGALDAHLHPLGCWAGPAPLRPLTAGDVRLLRGLGWGSVAGVIAWVGALAVAVQGPVVVDEHGSYRDGAAAMPFILAAGLLLAGGVVGHVIRLADDAVGSRLAALAAVPLLLIFVLGPWLLPIGGLAFGLLAVHAVSAARVRAWPVLPGAVVVASAVLATGALALGLSLSTGDRLADGVWFVAAFLAMAPTWIAVGSSLLEVRPSTSGPTPG